MLIQTVEEFIEMMVTFDPFYETSDDFRVWKKHHAIYTQLQQYAMDSNICEEALKAYIDNDKFREAIQEEFRNGQVSTIILEGYLNKFYEGKDDAKIRTV